MQSSQTLQIVVIGLALEIPDSLKPKLCQNDSLMFKNFDRWIVRDEMEGFLFEDRFSWEKLFHQEFKSFTWWSQYRRVTTDKLSCWTFTKVPSHPTSTFGVILYHLARRYRSSTELVKSILPASLKSMKDERSEILVSGRFKSLWM